MAMAAVAAVGPRRPKNPRRMRMPQRMTTIKAVAVETVWSFVGFWRE
jgi:hypothetical protein